MIGAANANSCRWVPWGIAGGFALLTGVLGTMTWLALHNFPGVWTEHAYEKGLSYNAALKASSEQSALGWKGDVSVTPKQDHVVEVDFALKNAASQPVNGAQVKLWFVRPSSSSLDRAIDMLPKTDGHYAAIETLPAPGVWDIKLSATREGKNYQMTKRIVTP